MSEHHGSVTVHAPIQQVYPLFTHFNDFPKFMSFVKEVTYYDNQRSHWVVQVAGTHEWDAVNDNWIPEQQVGWHSVNGLKNQGLVRFTPISAQQTQVDVYITYDPPAGALGEAADRMGLTGFEETLQHDLDNFAQMVEKAPARALDPMESSYLFHANSAVAKNRTTEQQNLSMRSDPMMNDQAMQQREEHLRQQQQSQQQQQQQADAAAQQRATLTQQASQQQEAALTRQAEINRQEEAARREAARNAAAAGTTEPDSVHDTIGGRDPSKERTAFGDQDARSERFPGYQTDPMTTRRPTQNNGQVVPPDVANEEVESPWRTSIRGGSDDPAGRAERERMQDQRREEEDRQQNQP